MYPGRIAQLRTSQQQLINTYWNSTNLHVKNYKHEKIKNFFRGQILTRHYLVLDFRQIRRNSDWEVRTRPKNSFPLNYLHRLIYMFP